MKVRRRFFVVVLLAMAGCSDGVGPHPPEAFVYTSVSAGGEHSCGVSPAGAVYCWGRGDLGALGDGVMGTAVVPVRPTVHGTALEVSAGFAHTCAVTDQYLQCWGWNRYGQLGVGVLLDIGTPVVVAQNQQFRTVSAGWHHTCALDLEGQAFCWGANAQGQVGNGTTTNAPAPVAVVTDDRFSSISAGAEHTCAVTVDGEGRCWGLNHRGQLGDNSTIAATTPVAVGGGHRFRSISAGFTHSCGLAEDQAVFCWGDNERGELGIGFRDQPGRPGALRPLQVIRPTEATQVSAGFHYSCAVDTARTAWCWGRGEDFQLGVGTGQDWVVPQRISDRDIQFSSISTGGLRHTCGLSRHGGAYCWGIGEHGQLGSTAVWISPVPVRVSGGQAQ